MHVCFARTYVCLCTTYVTSAHGRQKGATNHLELEMQTIVSHSGSAGNQIASALNCWASSPAFTVDPICLFIFRETKIRSPCFGPEHFTNWADSPVLEIFSKSGSTQHLHRGFLLSQHFNYKSRHFVPSSGNETNSPCWRSRVAINLVEERSPGSNFTFYFFMFVVVYISYKFMNSLYPLFSKSLRIFGLPRC